MENQPARLKAGRAIQTNNRKQAKNAMDAMPRGGRLDITLARADDGFVDLIVDDTGPGLGPGDPNRLFEPFQTSKEAGLGLGLAISKRIALNHGGKLIASNRPIEGARFVLRLPADSRIAENS